MDMPEHQLNRVLKRLMTECDMDDGKLAQVTGVPFTTIARMRANPQSNPTASSLRPIAKYFEISISQLLGDEPLSPERLIKSSNSKDIHSTRIPLIEWDKINAWINNNRGQHDDIHGWVSVDLPLSATSFAVRIENSAFGDTFSQNAYLVVDPSLKPQSGDYILIKANDDPNILLKEILFDGRMTYLKSVNPEFKQTIKLEEPYEYCGLVVERRKVLHTANFANVRKRSNQSTNVETAVAV